MSIDLYVAELINGHCHQTHARMTRRVWTCCRQVNSRLSLTPRETFPSEYIRPLMIRICSLQSLITYRIHDKVASMRIITPRGLCIQVLISKTQDWRIMSVSSWKNGTFILKYIYSRVSSAYICILTLYFRAIPPIGEVYNSIKSITKTTKSNDI